MGTYAVLGSTGNCGTALIEILCRRPSTRLHAYCRNKAKLLSIYPDLESSKQIDIFEGSLDNGELLRSCLRGCQAVFLVVATNDNIPGCRISQDTATAVLQALERLKAEEARQMPKLVLLSSSTIDEHFSRKIPWALRQVLLMSESFVYDDLRKTECLLREQESWITTIFFKPGALSRDIQRGHALSFTDESSPLSYLDLAAAMVEAVEDEDGQYDMKSVSVVNTNEHARFPAGTPLCIMTGLLRHFFPFLHSYLPMNTGP